MQKVPMTVKGAEKLREELNRLKSEERPRIIAAISEARAHGDLKENAEYHAAKEQQAFTEGRIAEVESRLSLSEIIDVTKFAATSAPKKVIFGATVVLLNLTTETEVTYQIVGVDEADLKQNLISVNSPIARAMIGKEVGTVFEVRTPGGEVEYEITEVRYE
jgi:transcription elongation factor GreA